MFGQSGSVTLMIVDTHETRLYSNEAKFSQIWYFFFKTSMVCRDEVFTPKQSYKILELSKFDLIETQLWQLR